MVYDGPLYYVAVAVFLAVVVEYVYGKYAGWWTPIRRWLWPKIHETLVALGGFSLSHVGDHQYVGQIDLPESQLDTLLVGMEFNRNPWAALKRRYERQDVSEGSWVYRDSTHWYIPDFLAHKQLHVTIFERADGRGYDIYAHWEMNYIRHPFKHLDGVEFSAAKGVRKMKDRLASFDVEYNEGAIPDPMIEQDGGTPK